MTDEAKLIIAGLRYCTTHDLCDGCPAKSICIDTDTMIDTHAGEMIEMQEQALDRLDKLYKDTLAELEQVKRERDAAVKDIPRACGYCKHAVSTGLPILVCHNTKCDNISNGGWNTGWEWRGPKEEEKA